MAKKNKREKLGEVGLVSILITMIMMIIISLIVLGFARLSRREQRQALDAQLSTQAFYAAESGVNDAIDAIQNNSTLASSDLYQDDCNRFINDASLTNELDGTNIQYSCLLIDNAPDTLEYTNISPGSAAVTELKSGGNAISELILSWRPGDSNNHAQNDCLSAPRLPTVWPAGCKNGILKVDMLPYDNSNQRFWEFVEATFTG